MRINDCSDTLRSSCRMCQGQDCGHFTAKEMMFGHREEFLYLECRSCGCVQISDYPRNIAGHYPDNYYSYQNSSPPGHYRTDPPLRRTLQFGKRTLMRSSNMLRRRLLAAGSTQSLLRSRPVLNLYVKHVPDADKRILDVGCGNGSL